MSAICSDFLRSIVQLVDIITASFLIRVQLILLRAVRQKLRDFVTSNRKAHKYGALSLENGNDIGKWRFWHVGMIRGCRKKSGVVGMNPTVAGMTQRCRNDIPSLSDDRGRRAAE
jgi:hypothetical protein